MHCLCEGALICEIERFVSDKINMPHILSVIGALLGPLELRLEAELMFVFLGKAHIQLV